MNRIPLSWVWSIVLHAFPWRNQWRMRIRALALPCCARCLCRALVTSAMHNQRKNCLQSNAIGVALIVHDSESLVKILIEPLDQHRIVVATAKDMAIDLKEVECLLAYPKEFAVLIKDAGVVKAKM
jgi:hypothetical protein